MHYQWLGLAQCPLLFLVAGCALSHSPTGESVQPGLCEPVDSQFTITQTTADGSTEQCELGPLAGWVDGAPINRDGALEFVLNDCPPGADCDANKRCQIRIEGSFVPPASALEGRGFLSGYVDENFLRLNETGGCCLRSNTLLYARNGPPAAFTPDLLVAEEEDLSFRYADASCGLGCGDKPYALLAEMKTEHWPISGANRTVSVSPGQSFEFDDTDVWVHLLSSKRDECTDEPGTASWLVFHQGNPLDACVRWC